MNIQNSFLLIMSWCMMKFFNNFNIVIYKVILKPSSAFPLESYECRHEHKPKDNEIHNKTKFI